MFANVGVFANRLFDSMSVEERVQAVPLLIDFPVPNHLDELEEQNFINPMRLVDLPETVRGDANFVKPEQIDELFDRLAHTALDRDRALKITSLVAQGTAFVQPLEGRQFRAWFRQSPDNQRQRSGALPAIETEALEQLWQSQSLTGPQSNVFNPHGARSETVERFDVNLLQRSSRLPAAVGFAVFADFRTTCQQLCSNTLGFLLKPIIQPRRKQCVHGR